MPLFLRKLLLFSAFAGVLFFGFFIVSHVLTYSEDSYMRAYQINRERIAVATTPKVLILGGSSLAFGVSSEKLTRALSRPVISLGLHAGQGIEYRLNESKPFIGKDDIVVLSIEYRDLNGEHSGEVIWNTVESNMGSFRYFGAKTWKVFLDESALSGFSRSAKRMVDSLFLSKNVSPKSPYTRSSFNEYGDVVGHYGLLAEREPYALSIVNYDKKGLEYSITEINAFKTFVKSKGARLVMILPKIPEGTFEASYAELLQTKLDLDEFCRVPILNSLESTASSDELFYDTEYHLTESGITQKTAEWLQLLGGFTD